MMLVLEQLGRASLIGGGAILLAWLIARLVPRLSAAARCTLWRLAFAKLLVVLAVASAVNLPLLPAPSWEQADDQRQARWKLEAASQEQPESEPAPAPSTPAWVLGLSALWLAGVLAGLGVTARAWRHARRLRGAATPVTSGPVRDLLVEISKNMGLSKAPALALVADGPGPMLTGLFRPTVLLPAELTERPEAELRMMLAHEVAHHARRDLFWNVVIAAARTVFFFHPLVHLAAREAALDQEAAADEQALVTTGVPARSYGELLLGLLRHEGEPLAALHAGSSAAALRRRLADLSRARTRLPARSRAGVAVLAIVAVALVVPWKLVQPEPDVTRWPDSMAIKDANLLVVVETIAINSGFIAFPVPGYEKHLVSVNFRDVPALDAIRQVAASAGLRVVRVPYMTTTPAYILMPPGHPEPVKVFTSSEPPSCSMAIKDASCRVLFETIAVNMGWNIVMDPALEKLTVSVNFRDVPPTEAMNYIADLLQVDLQEHRAPEGKPTWVVKLKR